MSDQRYLVAARKYRPQLFHELVAQEHVTGTLKNAIRLDRLAHAYLFSGPRGVGKTTAARILAKSINCTTPLEERADGAEPCRTCDSCRTFEEGRSLNIIEIDAASNNGVDDIRDLQERIRIPPQGANRKVYIVDEVHMLSKPAFNALLKTLEEPPPHALFIFATTEPHKVLPTILSRCQRFDFRRIPVPDITARLHEICEAESITADEASLLLLARKGDGALRDALSAFDQAVSLCGTALGYAELAQALGVVDVDLFFEVTQHAAGHDSAGMLRLVERIVRAGYDLQEFLVGLAEHLRNLLVAHTMPDTDLIEAAEATRRRYAEDAAGFAEADLLRLLMIVAEAEDAVKGSTQPRLKLEMALLKMAALTHSADLRLALQKIDRLEALAREGKLPAAPPTVVSEDRPPPPAPKPQPAAPRVEEPKPAAPRVEEPRPKEETPQEKEQEKPESGVSDSVSIEAPEEEKAELADEAAADWQDEPEADDEEIDPTPPPLAPTPALSSAPSPEPQAASGYLNLFGAPALSKKKSQEHDEPSAYFSGDGGATVADVALAVEAPPLLQQVEAAWPRYVKNVKMARIHVGALLQHTRPVGLDGETLLIAVPDDFHQRLLGSQDAFLLQHLAETAGDEVTDLRFVVQEAVEPAETEETAQDFDPLEYMQRKREESPVIRALFDKFGGEIVW